MTYYGQFTQSRSASTKWWVIVVTEQDPMGQGPGTDPSPISSAVAPL